MPAQCRTARVPCRRLALAVHVVAIETGCWSSSLTRSFRDQPARRLISSSFSLIRPHNPSHSLTPARATPNKHIPSPPQLHLQLSQSRPSSSSSSSNSRWKQRQGHDMFAREARVQGLKSRAAFKLLEVDAKHHLFKRGQVVVDLGFAPGSWSQVALERTKPDGRVVGIDILPAQPPKGVSAIQGNFLSPNVQALVKQFLTDAERRREVVLALRKAEAAEAATVGESEAEDVPAAQAASAEKGDGVHSQLTPDQDSKSPAEREEEVVDRPSYIDLERMAAHDSDLESETNKRTAKTEPSASDEAKEKKKMRLVDVVLSDMMMNTSGIAFRDHAGSMDLCRAALSFASDTLKTGGHFVCKFYQGSEDKAFENALKKMFAKVHREKPESSRSESRESFFVALKRKGHVTIDDIEF
ncbi:FtsJ-like methyltransferase-domain-containing protein [Podospora appendiculata]|uniref:rRNA methyltransferase 2, mitochondrial n=1 Tax=Podospora appendiculata TaxID=314037 RepID=A0AAE0X0I3_9PEZI|nr:FtsJ-like methyltransferase-domain-containing protein [Podospora appendiculata]